MLTVKVTILENSQLSVLALHHSVPFYAAVPLSTVDLKTENGDDIVIEQRPKDELAACGCHHKNRIPPQGTVQ